MRLRTRFRLESGEDHGARRYSLSMNGAQGGPGNAGGEPNGEDLDSVLGRFQDWAKARRAQPASKHDSVAGIGRGTKPKKANLAIGARELSYEQALRASSYRRMLNPEIETSPPAKPQAPVRLPVDAPAFDLRASPQHADVIPVAVAAPQRLPRTFHKAEFEPATTTRAKASTVVEAGTAASNFPRASKTSAPTRSDARPPTRPPGHRQRAGNAPNSRLPAVQRYDTARSKLEEATTVAPPAPQLAGLQTSTPTRRPQVAEAAFREVLQKTAGLVAAAKPSPVPETKSVALSLRVSEAEQARILACAARANLSVSAYLRQCALGVDALRDQVELALGELHKQDAEASRPPGFVAIPGILGRFASRCFRRLCGHQDYTGISLR